MLWLVHRRRERARAPYDSRLIANASQLKKREVVLDRRLNLLILLAVVFSIGHHIDHIIRGNHVGWPLSPEVNAFTYSLVIYPLLLTGWLLYRSGKVGPGFWLFLSTGGALFIAFIHVGPWAVESPPDIINFYEPPIFGWFAFAWLIAFVAVLAAASFHEFRLWRADRSQGRAMTKVSRGETT
jgi:hypothetical protein